MKIPEESPGLGIKSLNLMSFKPLKGGKINLGGWEMY